ncbi:poly [ADP-ribose] polymerase [Elysia marginata]|uniref:Poly [ADP-ribose] polymerase n=1 Tax=Elysia marginata TaxID=1093978 RepID=A0AAV4HR45_9GAST|nr:poly [ADP-ribose] polymerase [Elysia marginata]
MLFPDWLLPCEDMREGGGAEVLASLALRPTLAAQPAKIRLSKRSLRKPKRHKGSNFSKPNVPYHHCHTLGFFGGFRSISLNYVEMADYKNCLKVTGLPSNISEDELKIIFQNKRNKGGGPIDRIFLDTAGNASCALVYFKSPEAVEIILARGNTVKINEHISHVSKYVSASRKEEKQTKAPQSKPTNPCSKAQSARKLSQTQDQATKISKMPEQPKEKFASVKPGPLDEINDTAALKFQVRRTIKATLSDIWKSKDFYIYYLEDPSVSQDKPIEETLLLDCLNKVLYVTFEDEEGAMNMCQQKHGPDSNFLRVEMSTEADFNTYPNKVSVHGFPLKDKSKRRFLEFVHDVTGWEVIDIIQWNEPRSAILVFDEEECHDITEICWNLRTQFDGIKIMSAPVFRTKSVNVCGLPRGFDKCLLQRYLSNKRSGGGPVASVAMQDNVAIVTFKSEEHFFGVLQKKDHSLENHPLTIEAYYECLSRSTFKRSCSSKSPSVSSQAEDMDWVHIQEAREAEGSRPGMQSEDEDDWEDYGFCEEEESRMDLEKKDLTLLKNTDILKELQRKNKSVKISIDTQGSKAKFQGHKLGIQKAMTELLQWSMKRFEKIQLNFLTKFQLEVLQNDCVQHKVNAEFQKEKKQAVLVVEGNTALINFVQPASTELLTMVVKTFVAEETKKLSDPNARLLFISKLGLEHLSSLQKAPDGTSLGILVKYDEQNNSLLMVCPQEKKAELHNKIDEFMKENVINVKTVKCSEGKIHFLSKYRKDIMTSMKEKYKPLGVIITERPNSFELKGKKDEVTTAERELVKIRDSVFAEDFPLKFFAIKEYMIEGDGKFIKSGIENELACCICLPSSSSSGGVGRKSPESRGASTPLKLLPEPQVVATANFGYFTLHFVQGDLLGLKVAAIVNPVDETKQLNIGGLGKAIITQGGTQIQTDLMKTADSELVTVTSSGHLARCQHILHVVLQKFSSGSSTNVETAMSAVLDCASNERFSSVGFPCLGSGQIFNYPDLAVSTQTMSAVKKFLEEEATCPADIYICDKSDGILSSLIDRCELTFPDVTIDQLVQLEQKPKDAPTPRPRRSLNASASAQPKGFGNLQVKLLQGEITKWRMDAIVIAVDKSLDLKKGRLAKLVHKFGGDSVQDELNDNYPDGICPGEFAQSSGGNLKSKHIFYPCITHWKGANGPSQAQQMQKLIEDILHAANSIPVTSIAFPAIGTGNLNYPSDVVAKVFNAALNNFSKKYPNSNLKNVDLVIYPSDALVFQAFQGLFSTALPKSRALDEEEEENDDNNDEKDNNTSHGAFGSFFKSAMGKVTSVITGGGKNKTKYGSVSLTISKGDILQEKCDAIVCSIKNSMDLSASGAVCKNLLKMCGSSLQAECNNQLTAMQHTGVAKTSACGLPCQSIYFASMEKFSTSWDKGVLQVLTEAETAGATSIAMPLLGSGAKNPNMDLIKKRFLAGVEQFGKSPNPSLKDIRLVIFSQDMYDFFVGKAAPSKPDKSSPKEAFKPKPKVSDRIDLKLYCNDSAHADKIKKELIRTFKERFRSNKVENANIKQLSPKQIQELEYIGWESRVQITVRHEEGFVLLQSFFPTAKILTKLSSLMVAAVESHHINLLQATATAIVWQYQVQDENWKKFEPLLNAQIEKEYKDKSVDCFVTDAKNRKYKLDFSAMLEYFVKEDGSLSKHGNKIRRFDKTKAGEPLPKRWAPMSATENVKLVQIQSGGEEFKHVESLFKQGGANVPVKSISRIQNKFLYQQYMVKKREMDLRNGKGFQNEKRLFHGTSPNSLAAINENGFSNNYSGANATAYGEGSYFAVNSSYSVSYAHQDSSGVRHMYLVRVLVGKSTVSQRGMKYLPNQPGTNTPYDSGTDGGNGMYIIFHDAQTYPEYLISF